MDICSTLDALRDRVGMACEEAGRTASSVRMLAASKTVIADRIVQAMGAGQLLFGESRAQELRDKLGLLADQDPSPEWHFIGPLQRNKIKYLVGRVSLVHTIERLEIGQAIAKRMERDGLLRPMPILVEINLGSEQSKSGVGPDRALDLCAQLDQIPQLELRGLMALPPWDPDPERSLPHFERLAELAHSGRSHGLPLWELSMGMSHDFEQAIACGATIIRLGTAIFGPRDQPRSP